MPRLNAFLLPRLLLALAGLLLLSLSLTGCAPEAPVTLSPSQLKTRVAGTIAASFPGGTLTPTPSPEPTASMPAEASLLLGSPAPEATPSATPLQIPQPPDPTQPPPALDGRGPYLLPWLVPTTPQVAMSIPGPTSTPVADEMVYLDVIPLPKSITDTWDSLAASLLPYLGPDAHLKIIQTSETVEFIRSFYETQLPPLGWQWQYTDIGESQVTTFPGPTLVQHFVHPDGSVLSIAAIGPSSRSQVPSGGTLLFVGENISGGEVLLAYANTLAVSLDLVAPNPYDIRWNSMEFFSRWAQFRHPSIWIPIPVLRYSFPADNSVITFPEPRRCPGGHPSCLLSFFSLTATTYSIPVSLRVYQGADQVSLDEFDVSRARELQAKDGSNPVLWINAAYPEDLTAPGSVTMSERHVFSFRQGTSARQRIYRWRQVNLSQPLVSTYSLFRNGNSFIELHTDYSENEWLLMKKIIQEMVSYMRP